MADAPSTGSSGRSVSSRLTGARNAARRRYQSAKEQGRKMGNSLRQEFYNPPHWLAWVGAIMGTLAFFMAIIALARFESDGVKKGDTSVSGSAIESASDDDEKVDN